MCFGLPGRTSNATGVVDTVLPSGSLVKSWVISPAFWISCTSGTSERATMSAGNPLATFWAWAVLPPNEVWKMTCCLLCAAAHSFCQVEMSLPYASYGVLEAASVITGDLAGVHAPPDEVVL